MSKLGAKLPTGRLTHWTDLELMTTWERYQAELAESSLISDAREVGDPKVEIAKRISELEDQMNASGVVFELSAIPAKRWVELRADFSTEGKEEMSDADYMAFIDSVMREPGTVLRVLRDGKEIEFSAATDWEDEAAAMTLGQWSRFAEKVKELNANRVGAPKSQLASLVMRNFDKS